MKKHQKKSEKVEKAAMVEKKTLSKGDLSKARGGSVENLNSGAKSFKKEVHK